MISQVTMPFQYSLHSLTPCRKSAQIKALLWVGISDLVMRYVCEGLSTEIHLLGTVGTGSILSMNSLLVVGLLFKD